MSMKVNDILKLLDAGYTREEIQQMEQAEAPEEAAPVNTPEEPEETATEAVEASAANHAQPDPVQDQIARLTAAMERMSGMIISQNINRTVTEGAPGRTVEDMLAEVINPPRKEGKK